MSEHIESAALQWRDLSGDEVYYIAHLENDFRNQAAFMLSKVAFMDAPQRDLTFEAVRNLLLNQETRNES